VLTCCACCCTLLLLQKGTASKVEIAAARAKVSSAKAAVMQLKFDLEQMEGQKDLDKKLGEFLSLLLAQPLFPPSPLPTGGQLSQSALPRPLLQHLHHGQRCRGCLRVCVQRLKNRRT
jgi:outer membrane protein TolC